MCVWVLIPSLCTRWYSGKEFSCQCRRLKTHEFDPWVSWGDPLEVKMATHSSVPDLENSTDKGAWWATVHGVTKDLDMTEHSRLHTATTVYYRQGTSTLVL